MPKKGKGKKKGGSGGKKKGNGWKILGWIVFLGLIGGGAGGGVYMKKKAGMSG